MLFMLLFMFMFMLVAGDGDMGISKIRLWALLDCFLVAIMTKHSPSWTHDIIAVGWEKDDASDAYSTCFRRPSGVKTGVDRS